VLPRSPCAHILPPLPRWKLLGALFAHFPSNRGLPRFVGGSASTSAFSRPAQRSLPLQSACSPGHLRDPLHRRLRSLRLLHNRSDCYRPERKLPGGTASHWGIAPFHGAPQSWHTQSELVTPPSQLALVTRDAPRSLTLVKQLWFLGHNLAVFPNVIGVPCIRATSRAVRAARRIPRPTPAAKLSGFFGDFRRVVMVHALADSVWIWNSHILPNDPPAADAH